MSKKGGKGSKDLDRQLAKALQKEKEELEKRMAEKKAKEERISEWRRTVLEEEQKFAVLHERIRIVTRKIKV